MILNISVENGLLYTLFRYLPTLFHIKYYLNGLRIEIAKTDANKLIGQIYIALDDFKEEGLMNNEKLHQVDWGAQISNDIIVQELIHSAQRQYQSISSGGLQNIAAGTKSTELIKAAINRQYIECGYILKPV